jgi:hypothetical protein
VLVLVLVLVLSGGGGGGGGVGGGVVWIWSIGTGWRWFRRVGTTHAPSTYSLGCGWCTGRSPLRLRWRRASCTNLFYAHLSILLRSIFSAYARFGTLLPVLRHIVLGQRLGFVCF